MTFYQPIVDGATEPATEPLEITREGRGIGAGFAFILKRVRSFAVPRFCVLL